MKSKTSSFSLMLEAAEIVERRNMAAALSVVPPPTVASPPTVVPPPTVNSPAKRRGVTAFTARTVQDAHTRSEQQLYLALWNSANGNTDSRITQAGNAHLMTATGLSVNQLRRNLASLVAKLAIECMHGGDYTTARTWRVHSYRSILERRRAACLTWVLRHRGSVELTVPPPTVISPPTVASPPTVGVGGPPTVASMGPPTVGGPLDKEEETSLEEKSSSSLLEATPDFDDDARLRLITACHQVAADVTEDEIAYFTCQKREQLRGRRQIENPIGMLLKSVPVSLKGSGLQRYRAAKAEEARQVEQALQRQEAQAAELIAKYERTLSDPGATKDAKDFAREGLAMLKTR